MVGIWTAGLVKVQITVTVFGLDTHQQQGLLVNRRLKPTKDRLAEHVIFPFQCKSKAIFFSYFLSFYSVLFFLERMKQNVYFVLFFSNPHLYTLMHSTAHHPTPFTLLLVDKQGVQHALLLHP